MRKPFDGRVLSELFQNFVADRRNGITDVDGYVDVVVVGRYYVGAHREVSRIIVQSRHADFVVEEQPYDFVVYKFYACKRFQHFKHGVVAELRRGTVRRFTVCDIDVTVFFDAEFFRIGYIADDFCLATVADDVHSVAAGNRKQLFVLSEREFKRHYAFFGVDNGEVGIGRKPVFGHLRDFIEMFYAFPACFFVAT